MKNSTADWLEVVRDKVESLRFGVVQITIHDSRVTQIERTEKMRIEQRASQTFNRPDKLEDN